MKVRAGMALLVGISFLVLTTFVSAQEIAQSNTPSNSTAAPSRYTATEFVIKKPASNDDIRGWNAYLGALLKEHLEGMTAPVPYAYFIPAGDGADNAGVRQRQLDNVRIVVARGIKSGNLVAIAGPDSAVTADVIVDGFRNQPPNSCKGAILVFMGEKADWPRVAEAWQSTGAILRFVDLSISPRPIQLRSAPAHAVSSAGNGAKTASD